MDQVHLLQIYTALLCTHWDSAAIAIWHHEAATLHWSLTRACHLINPCFLNAQYKHAYGLDL